MKIRWAWTLRVMAIGLLALAPGTARAANTCNAFIAVDYITAQAFQTVGDMVRVGVTLGTGPITGGTQATVNRIRFDLDCNSDSPLGLGCAGDGSVISYGGDDSISTTCPAAFSTGHAASDSPNQVVFTPDVPFDIPAGTPDFCVIEFDVEMVGFSNDSTPTSIEEVVGYSSATGDLACNNGLSSSGSQSAAILTCPPCDDQNACTQDVCNRETGKCDPGTPRVCNEGDPGTDGNFCTPPSCNTTTGNCQDGPARVCNEGDPGTDGSLCTPPICNAATGNCTNGAPRICNEGDPGTDGSLCTPPVCDAATGNCTNGAPRVCNEGDPGTDGSLCTPPVCDAATGNCTNGAPRVCNEGDPGTDGSLCTPPVCDAATGNCTNGAPRVCNEGDPGTDGSLCTPPVCNAATGNCTNGAARVCNEGDPGTDGSLCTPPVCDAATGNCTNGAPRVCNEGDPGTDGNFCTPPVCNAATGNCTNGAPRVCNEGDPGTDGSLCTPPICDPSSGNCTNGTSRNCDDNNVCTNDRCDPATGGCVNQDNGTCGGGEGCTPGYWKQSQHFGSWTAPYTPSTLFSAVFENAFPGKTLLQVLGQGGGGLIALGRHTVSALLNAASPDVDSDLTAAEVIARFNAVFPGGDYEKLKNEFAGFNEQSCPLGRNP